MCAICGCSGHDAHADAHAKDHHHHGHDHDHGHGHDHDHDHGHDHHHGHDHGHHDHHDHPAGDDARSEAVTVKIERAILEKNARLAELNRRWLADRHLFALNLVSSPGAGKTTLLERTIGDLAPRVHVAVLEGDQATSRDADRVRAAGARALQINTGAGCHLDAAMVARALPEIEPPTGSLVAIENVGNLVCPALFDLGEHAKVLVASVTEGDDKPLKYPHMFRACSLVLLNKIDLLEYVRFDVDRFAACTREVNPGATILRVSATRGDGLSVWYRWLEEGLAAARRSHATERTSC